MTLRRARLIAAVGEWLIRGLICTLRLRIEDRAGVTNPAISRPVLWALWHNRLLIVPYLFERFLRGCAGVALTSASKDGDLLAAMLARFGGTAIRGSSSRRGATGWRELRRAVEAGAHAAITPDGPRGPRYHLNPGLLLLAQKTGVPIMPVRVRYSRKLELKSWDGFQIPLPFARVDVIFDQLTSFPDVESDAQFEEESRRLEALLRQGLDDVPAHAPQA